MTENRERDVTKALVSLASSLVNGYDIVDLLSNLTADCARLLDVGSAGLLLANGRGVLSLLAASSEATEHLELFQLQQEEGPCLDCYKAGSPVLVPDLGEETDRWPQFAARAGMAGFVSVHALPMRLRGETLGTLGLFGTTVGALNTDDLNLGQALADVASVSLVQDSPVADKRSLNEQLQGVLTSRVVIEQAKGVLAQQGGSDMTEAFALLRRYARDHNLRLTDVAQGVVSRSLAAELLSDNAVAGDKTGLSIN
jgi:transcriptional regulator with GAF, ATPase, and Fis domain